MEKFYIRTTDLEKKVHSVKLPYLAWKVLFLLAEKQSVKNLTELLDEKVEQVEKAISILEKEGLAQEAVEAEQEAAPVEEEKEPERVETEGKEEEIAVEQPAVSEEAPSEEPLVEEPVAEPLAKAEQLAEALPEEEAEEEEEESALEESDEFKGIGDFELPELEEESDLEEETSELESKVSEIEEPESEIDLVQVEEEATEKLEVDFENIEEPAVEEEVQEEKIERAGAPNLLVIDDSIVIRKMVELALEGEDVILDAATSGKEGLKKLDEVKPDIVILDLMLPDISGIDLLKTIKASLGIPVIMLSGKDSPQMIEKAKAEGADAFLPKPFRDEDLVKTIHELLKK